MTDRGLDPMAANPLRDPRGPAAAPGAGAVRAGRLRRHRRPGPQEADPGGLRPGQPGPAAARLRAARLRPPRLGRRRLRGAGPRGGRRSTPAPRGGRRSGTGWPATSSSCRARSTTTTRSTRWPTTLDELRDTPRHQRQRGVLPVDPAGRRSRSCSSSWSAPAWPTTQVRRLAAGRGREAVRHTTWQSARELNELVDDVFTAEDVFRIDHYLGKETVQNILALRFANSLFEPMWNSNYVDSVQITMAEDVGIGGRAALLRRDRRGPRRPAEPPAAAARADRDGGAGRVRRRGDPHREAQGAAGGHAARRPRAPTPSAGSTTQGWLAGERAMGYRAGGGRPAGLDDRDLRRGPARHRDPALGRRAVLPAHRQAAAAPGHRDRDPVQEGAAPAVRHDRHRGAGQQPAGRSGCSPTRA